MNPVNFAFVFSIVVSGLLALLIIGLPIIVNAFDGTYEPPAVIKEWGGVVIGYYFGSMTAVFLKFFDQRDIDKAPVE